MVNTNGLDITFYRKDTVDIPVIITGYELAEGDHLIMSVKYGEYDTADYDVTNLKFKLSSADSSRIKPGRYEYQIRIEYASGERNIVLADGTITVLEVFK